MRKDKWVSDIGDSDDIPYRSRKAADGWSFVPCTDDFHPTFDGCLGIRLYKFSEFVIQITDADDLDLEKKFESEAEARSFLLRLPSVINYEWLKGEGFL